VRLPKRHALASYGVERAWPFAARCLRRDGEWLVRCSILFRPGLKQPQIDPRLCWSSRRNAGSPDAWAPCGWAA